MILCSSHSNYQSINKLFGKFLHDHEGDKFEDHPNDRHSPETVLKRVWRIEISKRVAAFDRVGLSLACHLVVSELIQHVSLESVSEHCNLRERPQELRDVVLVHKEAGEQHRRHDQDRSHHHLHLLVRNRNSDQVPKPGERVVNQGGGQ